MKGPVMVYHWGTLYILTAPMFLKVLLHPLLIIHMDGFTLADHERLAALFRNLDSIGAKVMLSNNDVPLVRSLYEGYRIQSFGVKRMINRNSDKRTGKEVLITNY